MSEAGINILIIVVFVVVTAICLFLALRFGKRYARRFGASEQQLDEAFGKARSKIGLVAAVMLLAAIGFLIAAWLYLNSLPTGPQ